MLIDLHVHSSMSEGVSFSTDEIVSLARERGLDGICFTDVHSMSGARETKQAGQSRGLVVLVGFEAITDRGHYLAFVPDPEAEPDIASWLALDEKGKASFEALAEAVEGKGGILIAAHPYDKSVEESPGDAIIRMKGISAVEVLNGNRRSQINELAEELAAGAGLPGVGGSDGRENLNQLGKTATLSGAKIDNEVDLINCVREADVWPVTIGKPKPALSRNRGESRQSAGRRAPRGKTGKDGRKPSRGGPGRGRRSGHHSQSRSNKPGNKIEPR